MTFNAPHNIVVHDYRRKRERLTVARRVGYEVMPHTRRGHFRTYKSGKTVYIRSTIIHKDKYTGVQSAHRIKAGNGDGRVYYVINNNMGYDGDLELAMIPESFRTDVLKEKLDANGVLIENSESELEAFALLFEFDGDKKHIRHVLYNCAASRPGIEGKTNEESREVQTETLTIKASPLPDGKVKAKTGDSTDTMTYNNGYKAVYLPTEAPDPEPDPDPGPDGSDGDNNGAEG